ncbi:hypothetical protein [Polyangium mundeleinium]|uniref:Uncharacterized protein n=1 Tax=Polyangium mundeleinium TaxID=2995306 RepID=A0ABT5F003_9BACT|nr:hypothetical protein [Polyangium mundeleinium]MDC0746842.1 hypothetical protein [Polyangium mundeleinium]
MLNGPFADNTTLEVVLQGNVVGYVFACPPSLRDERVHQEQRWVLYEGALPLPPTGIVLRTPITLREPVTTLADWNATWPGLWRKGAHYVKVYSASYDSIRTAVPPPAPPLSDARSAGMTTGVSLPTKRTSKALDGGTGERTEWGAEGGEQTDGDKRDQIDYRFQSGVPIATYDATTYGQIRGYVFGTAIPATSGYRTNMECWTLLPGYAPPGSRSGASQMPLEKVARDESGLVGVVTNPGQILPTTVNSLGTFQQFSSAVWKEGSTYVIATCAYLDAPPADP